MTQRMNENLLKAMFLALLFIFLMFKVMYRSELPHTRRTFDAAREEAPLLQPLPEKNGGRQIVVKEVFRRH